MNVKIKYLNRDLVLIVLFMFCFTMLRSQAPFTRGVNLTSWFQVGSAQEIQFTKFTKKDINDIKSLGCDVIRLPISLHDMTSGAPQYILDPLFFTFLDSAVTWCEELNIYLILDNHSFDPNIDTSPGVADILVKVWTQMAFHYKDRSKYILYEILNEPHGISTSSWGTIQNQAINAIRNYDKKHTIVVGGSGYNTYTELKNLPVYSDTNLLYTFHFYDPFMFTHQGATWVVPSMAPLAGVPFPYNPAEMPACPPSLKGTWIESSLNSYYADGTEDKVRQLIYNAVSFRAQRKVNLFCGEFGVYIPNSDNADRCHWYKVVKDYLDNNNIPWTSWDYKGGFGLFNKGSNEFFEHDLNVRLLDSLDLNVPEQTPFSIKPDSAGFLIYTDFIGQNINNSSYSNGPLNFYSGDLPANGQYCIYWNPSDQYNAIGFDFVPDKDLSRLVSENYALDLMVRGNNPAVKFEIRFRDSKTSEPDDHPWRMGITIDSTNAAWDRRWHHLHIPLTSFTERGAWDNDTWYEPVGKFDWIKTDVLEISTEWTDILGKKVWFDNIHITNLDTAVVRVNGTLGVNNPETGNTVLTIAPNPMRNNTDISFTIADKCLVKINIYEVTGVKICTLVNRICFPGTLLFSWNGRCDNGLEAGPGIYFCNVILPGHSLTGRIIKY